MDEALIKYRDQNSRANILKEESRSKIEAIEGIEGGIGEEEEEEAVSGM